MERIRPREEQMVQYWNTLHPEWGPIFVWFGWYLIGSAEAWLPFGVSWPIFLPEEEKQKLQEGFNAARSELGHGWTTDRPTDSMLRQSLEQRPNHRHA